MYLERLLQINMATLAALGALLLGMGQRSEGPPLLVVAAAALSIWLTDVTGRFQIGRRAANLLMLAAAAVSFRELYPLRGEMQTIGLSWFVIYLQIILLFQKKDERKYWLLVMLSLLQVLVATLFSQGIWFGMLLAVYMMLGFSAMTLLMLYRQWEHYRPATKPSPQEQKETATKSRWPLLARRSEFTGLPVGSVNAGVGRDLFSRLGRMGLHTLALTAVLFFAVPRFGHVAWRGAVQQPQAMVGFTDEVSLGELGQVIESREEVLRAQFFRDASDVSQPLHGDVYLQGALLMKYKGGQWSAGMASANPGLELSLKQNRLPELYGVTKQKYRIEGMDCGELFFVAPYIALDRVNEAIDVDCEKQRLLRADYLRSQQWNYTLGTTAIVNNEQLPLTPAGENDRTFDSIDVPTADLPGLIALGKRWIAESGLPEGDKVGRVRYLERKFAMSNEFQYSLVGQKRDPTIDPIEDFVTQHKKGHCEYFATALVLMLRSQGYSARMVSGYKCDMDDWNAMGRFYQVRQLHAHTWVEVHLWPGQIPKELIHGKAYWAKPDAGRSWDNGGWLRLDPTPGGGANANWFLPVRNGLDWMESAWSMYVMELDCERQRDAIYKPIAEAAKSVWKELTNPDRWRWIFATEADSLYLDHLGREVRWMLLAVLGLVLVALTAGVGWLFVRVGRRVWSRWTGRPIRRRGRQGVEIAFYRHFERLMARRGLVRAPQQTQREFAAAAGAKLAASTGEESPATLTALIADAFYRVRFGRTPLDNLQAQAVEQALGELSKIGNRSRGG